MQTLDSLNCLLIARSVMLMALMFASGRSLVAEDHVKQARQTLLSNDLTEIGHNWLCADELELRRQLARIGRLKHNHKETREAVDVLIAANRSLGRKLEEAQRRQKTILKRIESARANLANRRQLQSLAEANKRVISGLKRQYRDQNQFGQTPEVRRQVVRLINARNELVSAVTAIRRDSAKIAIVYPRLRSQKEIVQSLAELGKPSRLGPARNYRSDLSRLSKIDPIINSLHVPVFRQDDHFRVPVLVNERYPTIFSIRHSSGPSIVPRSLLRAAGIQIAADAPHGVLRLSGKRRLKVRQITIDSLRIGSVVYRDIKAFALPPEGEDLGARLGKDAYASRPFEIDGLQLRLAIEARSE